MGRENRKMGQIAVFAAASVLAATFGVGATRAATILNFEGGGADGGEGLVNTDYTIGSFGATSGTHADDVTQGPGVSIFDIGTVNAQSTGPALNHFNEIAAGAAEPTPQISFDISLNTAGVTTDGYLQITLIGNSQNGYFQLGYGDLINGYNVDEGLQLGALATTEGATLTATTPFANGVGTYHFTIPLFAQAANSDQKHPTFGDGAGGTSSSYDQFSLVDSGGFSGTAEIGIDNVQIGTPVIAAVPEPASLGLIALAAPALLRRRRKA